MWAICQESWVGDDVLGSGAEVTAEAAAPSAAIPRWSRLVRQGGFPMSPIEIQEPEVKPAEPASCQMAAILPSSDIIWGPALPPKTMFSDSLLEFGVQRKRKFLATTTSLIVNCLAIVAMLIIPLAFPEALPKAQRLTFLVAPPPPPPPPAAAEVQHVVRQIQTDMLNNGALRTPTKIPQKIQMIKEEEAPPPMPASGGVVGGVVGGVAGGIPGGQMGGVI